MQSGVRASPVCLSVCLSIHPSIHPSIYLSIHTHIYIYVCIYLFIYVRMSAYLCAWLGRHRSAAHRIAARHSLHAHRDVLVVILTDLSVLCASRLRLARLRPRSRPSSRALDFFFPSLFFFSFLFLFVCLPGLPGLPGFLALPVWSHFWTSTA